MTTPRRNPRDPDSARLPASAVLYLNRTGISWRYIPHDFPPHGTVYYYYAKWHDEGILAQLNLELTRLARAKVSLREQRRNTSPRATRASRASSSNTPPPWA